MLVFGTIGLVLVMMGKDFMHNGTFLYYTVQSNILAMLVALVTMFYEHGRLRGKAIPPAVYLMRLISTVAITLTFLVFSLMLTPEMLISGNTSYLSSPENIFVHNLVPIACILDWCFYGSMKDIRRGRIYLALLPAAAYATFMLGRAMLGFKIGNNLVPYFFLDYTRFGWLKIGSAGIGVIWWILIIAAILIVLSRSAARVADRNDKKKSEQAG